MAVRLYTEPDVNWWIDNRRKDYYDLNSIDDAALINQRDEKTYAVRDMDEAARALPCARFSRDDDGSWVSSAVIITPPDNHWERTRFKGAAARILDRRCGDNLGARG